MRAAVVCVLPFVAAIGAQVPIEAQRTAVRDHSADVETRCAQLSALQDAGQLDVPTVLAALGDAEDALSRMAAAIVRHEWVVLPPALFEGLDRSHGAARQMLRELAIAPRPAAAAWVETWTRPAPGHSADDRCLALAASVRPLGMADAEVLLATLLAGVADDGFYLAVSRLPAEVADALLARLHGHLLQQQLTVDQVAPFLDRLSPAGCERLSGLAVTLPEADARPLCRRLAERDVGIVRERVRAMLDGETPLESLWLAYAGPLLDSEARRERVRAVLKSREAAPELQQAAFDALLDARFVDATVIAWALDGTERRASNLRRLLAVGVEHVPATQLVEWLSADPDLSTATVQALVRLPKLGPALEARLRATMFDAGWIEGPFLTAAAMAIAQRGSAAALTWLWPLLRASNQLPEFVEAMAVRRDPFVHEQLLAELDEPKPERITDAERQIQLDAVRLALVTVGDRRQLAQLVAHAARGPAVFVRRCSHYARPLEANHAHALLDAARGLDDVELAAELVAWAATSSDASVVARLQQLWSAPASTPSELQDVALRALAAGPFRDQLAAELRAGIGVGAPTPENGQPTPTLSPQRIESLGYEIVATMPSPLSRDDLRMLAQLTLLPPLHDAGRERQLAARWPDGRFGFPFVAAVAQRLRGSEPALVREVFGTAAAEVLADDRRSALSRQRLLVAWRSLEADRPVQAALGQALAELMLALPGDVGAGPAHWYAGQVAAERGDFAAAAAHARAAVRLLLRDPTERRTARLFLGERDPSASVDPWAALAATPYLMTCREAAAKGDAAASEAAGELVREFAGRDQATLASLPRRSTQELDR